MAWHFRIVATLALCSVVVSMVPGQEPEKKTMKVEFRWLEDKPIKGVTDEKGFPVTCGNELWYPHLKPILMNKDVAEARFIVNDKRNGASIENYEVKLLLTKEAKKALADSCGRDQTGALAVFVDGKYKGTHVFRSAQSEAFTPSVGYIGFPVSKEQKAEAIRLSESFKDR
jgi:hypothetical protein